MTLKKILFLSAVCLQSVAATPPLFQEDHQTRLKSSAIAATQRYVLPPEIVSTNRIIFTTDSEDLKRLSSDDSAYEAQESFKEGNYTTALFFWQQSVSKSYAFPREEMKNFAFSLHTVGLHHEAYNLWKWVAREYPTTLCPECYYDYAAVALSVGDYPLAQRMIMKYLMQSEDVSLSGYLVAAQASLFTNKPETAVKYYDTFLALEEPNRVPERVYSNAASAYYLIDNCKEASKCIDLLFKHYPDLKHNTSRYADAAVYAHAIGESDKAVRYWEKYFSMPDANRESKLRYAHASGAYMGIGNFERAAWYLEEYFRRTPKTERTMLFMLDLGKAYLMMQNYKKACEWYDVALLGKNARSPEIRKLSKLAFFDPALAYFMNGDVRKAEQVLALLGVAAQEFARLASRMEGTLPQAKGAAAKKKAKTNRAIPALKESTPARVQGFFRNVLLEKCNRMQGVLKKIDFSNRQVMEQAETQKAELLAEINTLKQKITLQKQTSETSVVAVSPSAPSSSTAGQSHCAGESLVQLQCELINFEKKISMLERLYKKDIQQRKKEASIAFLKQLSEESQEVIEHSPAPNMRAAYGHEKTQSPVCSSSAPASSTEMTALVIEAPKNHVEIIRHRYAEKHYAALDKVPGMQKKYNTFVREITENPLQIEGTSGRTKLLHGEAGLFARRFDKENRFVYKVTKSDDGTYHVIILSLLGHYKNLDHQLQHLGH
jgi:tetratricopeptide (TPR) repeat protein/Txe/YoeB family toxin of Txe-Axe toxin-antitoxin module